MVLTTITLVRHAAMDPSMAQHMTRDWTDVSSFDPFARATGKILALISVLSSRGTRTWKHFSQALTTCAKHYQSAEQQAD